MMERRRERRVPKEALVYYSVSSDDDSMQDAGMAKTLDMSRDGLHLQFSKLARQGDRLRMTVSIDDEMVDVNGMAVWARGSEGGPFEAGVKTLGEDSGYSKLVEKLN